MGKGFKHGGGSSPSDVLNFKIIGGQTKPSDPKENTIWVNTPYDVGTWDVSPVEPSRAVKANGDVWLKLDPYGTMAFNALKKNSIVVHLGTAYVYANGWVECDAEVYQDGAWNPLVIPWDGYYFKDGDQYNAVTGGWTTDGWGNTGTVTVGSTIAVSSPAVSHFTAISTANTIDLTDAKKLCFDSPNGANGYSPGYLCVISARSVATASIKVSVAVRAGRGSVDVSGLSGKYHLCLYAPGSSYADVSAVWME